MLEIKVNIALTDETMKVLENLIQAVHGIGEKSAPSPKKKSTKKKEAVEETSTTEAPTTGVVPVEVPAPPVVPTTPTVAPTAPTVVVPTAPTMPSTATPTVATVPTAPSPQASAPTSADANAAATVQAPSPQVPTQGVMYTAQQLSIAGAELVDAGKMPELQALLQQFGVPAITSLDPAYYPAFAEGLRALGGRI